jgi:hypothetical protein
MYNVQYIRYMYMYMYTHTVQYNVHVGPYIGIVGDLLIGI